MGDEDSSSDFVQFGTQSDVSKKSAAITLRVNGIPPKLQTVGTEEMLITSYYRHGPRCCYVAMLLTKRVL